MSAVPTAPPELGRGQEYVAGVVRERHRSALASFVTGNICFALGAHADATNAGWVSGAGATYCCFPDDPGRVRRTDTAFHRLDRLTPDRARAEGHLTVVPDLVVEVVSPNDLADDVNRKRVEWLAAGAGLVWVVFPLDREVHAHPAGGPVRVFGPADALTAEPVLPGFRTPVADLFRLPGGG